MLLAAVFLLQLLVFDRGAPCAQAPTHGVAAHRTASRVTSSPSADYQTVQRHVVQGWNAWDVNSMTTHVLLPEGLAIHIGFKHNATVSGDEFLAGTSVG